MADRYTVTSQTQTMELAPNGQFQDVMEVHFTVMSTGDTGSVRVPLSQYTPDNVRAAIEYRIEQIEGVANL
jgi:hypothetical protein